MMAESQLGSFLQEAARIFDKAILNTGIACFMGFGTYNATFRAYWGKGVFAL